MQAVLLVAALTLAGPPAEPALPVHPPAHLSSGTGLLTLGVIVKVAALGMGITGIVIWNPMLPMLSIVPSSHGGAALVLGSRQRARYDAAYSDRDLWTRVRPARRAGWSLVGVGVGLWVGTLVAYLSWPMDPWSNSPHWPEPLYPGGYQAVLATFVAAPLLIGAGSSAVMWSDTYRPIPSAPSRAAASGFDLRSSSPTQTGDGSDRHEDHSVETRAGPSRATRPSTQSVTGSDRTPTWFNSVSRRLGPDPDLVELGFAAVRAAPRVGSPTPDPVRAAPRLGSTDS